MSTAHANAYSDSTQVIGVQLFYNVAHQDAFGRHANFEAFDTAFITLFRCITGDGWTPLMDEASRGLCRMEGEDHKHSCGGSIRAPVYFYTFTILGAFVVLNLFVVVMLDNLEASAADNANPLSPHRFQKCWQKFAIPGLPLLHVSKIEALLIELGMPLGISCIALRSYRRLRLLKIRVPVRHGCTTYAEMYDPCRSQQCH